MIQISRRISFKRYIIAISIFTCMSSFAIQDREQSIKNRIDKWQRELINYPLPPNSIMLEPNNIFPDFQKDKEEIFLKRATYFTIDKLGNFFISDTFLNKIFVFNNKGIYKKSIGKSGRGPGDIYRPKNLGIDQFGRILVDDSGNGRIQIFDNNGLFISSSKYYHNYYSSSFSKFKKSIHSLFGISGPLIHVLNDSGELERSFGNKIEVEGNSVAIHEVSMSINKSNEIFVLWKFLPVLQVYSIQGEFLREIRFHDKRSCDYEKVNLLNLRKPSSDRLFKILFSRIVLLEDRFILFSYYPRLEFKEYSLNGEYLKCYWYEGNYDHIYSDFQVKEIGGQNTFFVLQNFPQNQLICLQSTH